jgi:phage FluMu gp28-like protein
VYEDRSFLIGRSEDVIADHRNVTLVNGRPTMSDKRIKGSDGDFRHGDSAIAGLMSYVATQAEGHVQSYETVRIKGLR